MIKKIKTKFEYYNHLIPILIKTIKFRIKVWFHKKF